VREIEEPTTKPGPKTRRVLLFTPEQAQTLRTWRRTVSEIGSEVYFIQCTVTKLVKVGKSTDTKLRFDTLAATSPTILDFRGSWPGTRREEAILHEHFDADRHHGEWFKETLELMGCYEKRPAWLRA